MNFYRQFIYIYSWIAAPLTDLLKKSVKDRKMKLFILIQDAVRVFKELKQVFTDAMMLNHFNSDLFNQCEINVSENDVCGIFLQLTLKAFQC